MSAQGRMVLSAVGNLARSGVDLTDVEAVRQALDLLTCPIWWCQASPNEHDPDDRSIGDHAVYVFDHEPFGDIGVHQTITRGLDGEIVRGPAAVYVDLGREDTFVSRDGLILAKSLELAALIADGINAGEWNA